MIRDSFAIPAGINSESSENHCGISFRHLRNYCRTEHLRIIRGDYSGISSALFCCGAFAISTSADHEPKNFDLRRWEPNWAQLLNSETPRPLRGVHPLIASPL